MIEKIILDMLSQDSVSVKKQQYTVVEGKEYAIGEPWRRAYANSVNGRKEVQEEIEEPYKAIIFMMWGDSPTISEDEQ